MIRPDSIYGIGRITRTHGVNGKVELQFTDDVFDRADAPYLFLEMDGLPVPFFWEEYSFKNQHAALFKFEDVDNEQQARRLVGAQVFYDRRFAPHTAPDMDSFKFFVGYRVLLPDGREVGGLNRWMSRRPMCCFPSVILTGMRLCFRFIPTWSPRSTSSSGNWSWMCPRRCSA